ncbi:MAG: TlpA disulfide reductase family protein [Wenzhouxiangella sp.]|nr:TlpA disulfide reductase family protein [Wenzhouxiangella sp.]
MSRMLWMYVGAAVLGLALGGAVAWFTRPPPPDPGVEGAQVGDPHPGFRHGGLDGAWVDAQDFQGQVLIVNFWATWCAPCRREMPILDEMARAHPNELAIVGLAIDDLGDVQAFIEEVQVAYPIAVGNADVMATQRAWGNTAGALPYTVLVDRQGIVRWQHLGEFSAEELQQAVQPWL